MDASSWTRVRELFEAAAGLDEAAQAAFLERSCGGDQDLRREVESLLQAHDSLDDDFLAAPAALGAAAAAPERLGPYAIERELGAGGMGTVYLAARADAAYEKRVAIKVIRPGMDSEAVLRRFAAERRILAALDHPNIAKLLDAGTTPEGLPYFVMEYIEGEPLDLYCERVRPSLRERLAIFRRVCDAVDEAHRKLVLHRDLKPGNILVDERGTPKLLDFGIAKLLAADGAGDLTEFGIRPMTPLYASPEQSRGEPLTTASDVYALGVVLFQLVTGRLPAATPAERPGVAADLDNIVLMALRPEPERRYASAARLGEDLDRFLAGRPVLARPLTLGYRARKFVSRHRGGVAAALAVAASLLAGVVALGLQYRTTLRERERAERRFEDVRELASAFVFEFDQAIRDLPGSTPARALVVRRGLEYLDRLALDSSGDAALLAELAAAYDQLGDLQGGFRAANLGDTRGALDSYRKALALRQHLADTSPNFGADLAHSHARVGALLFSRGESAAAEGHLREAIAGFSTLTPAPIEALAGAHSDLGYLLENRGEFAAAIEIFDRAERLQPLPPTARIKLESRRARALSNLPNRRQEALAIERRVVAMADEAAAAAPESAPLRWTAMMQHAVLGILEQEAGAGAAADDQYRAAIDIGQQLLAADRENAQWRYDLALCHALLGWRATGVAARTHLARSLELSEPLQAKDPEDADVAGVVALAHAGLAVSHAGTDCAEAARWHEKSAPVFERLEARGVQSGWERRLAAETRRRLEPCLAATG